MVVKGIYVERKGGKGEYTMSRSILLPVLLNLGDVIFTHVLLVYQRDDDDFGRSGRYPFCAIAEEP